MKKTFFAVAFLTLMSVSAQKKNNNLLESSNITEIENFLKSSHPDDPRRIVLKSKLIALKNSSWMKSGQNPYKTAKPVILEIPKSVVKQTNNDETEEFKRLIKLSSTAHKEKTVKLLNQLFDNDITSKEAILLVQNNSDCNMIVRIQGAEFYNLAVPAHGENSLVVKKGDYQLLSNVCDAKYSSLKNIGKNMLVILNNPVVSNLPNSYVQTNNPAIWQK